MIVNGAEASSGIAHILGILATELTFSYHPYSK